MSTPIQLKVTAAGRAAQLNAKGTGFALDLSHIQFGTGHRSPSGAETALLAPQQVKYFAAGSKPIPTQIRASVVMPGISVYQVNEIGVWAGEPGQPGSVLYAYWSSPATTLTNMAVGQDLVLSFDMTLDDGAAISIVVDPVEAALFALITNHESSSNPHSQYVMLSSHATQAQAEAGTSSSTWTSPLRVKQAIDALVPVATEVAVGKSRLATSAEAVTGTSNSTAVHPAGLLAAINSRVPSATESVQGKVELATSAETLAGTDQSRATHPAGVIAAINSIVSSAINALVNSSPAALNQLNELAAAIGNDPSFATTMANALATKLNQTQADARYSLIHSHPYAPIHDHPYAPIHDHPYEPAGVSARKTQLFTYSTTFYPAVSGTVFVTLIGAGGGGGSGHNMGMDSGGGGGGAGGVLMRVPVSVTAGVGITIITGGGGEGGQPYGGTGSNGNAGGTTVFGPMSVSGGMGGLGGTAAAGGDGGKAGGSNSILAMPGMPGVFNEIDSNGSASGGSGGTTVMSSGAAVGTFYSGDSGIDFGGGGAGGGSLGDSAQAGGTGADGAVIIEY